MSDVEAQNIKRLYNDLVEYDKQPLVFHLDEFDQAMDGLDVQRAPTLDALHWMLSRG